MADHHHHDAAGYDCEAALAEVYTYLDGEMTEERRRVIAAHLEGCSPCFEAFDFEAELRMVISARCRNDAMPDALRLRIVQRLQVIATSDDAVVPPRPDEGAGSGPA